MLRKPAPGTLEQGPRIEQGASLMRKETLERRLSLVEIAQLTVFLIHHWHALAMIAPDGLHCGNARRLPEGGEPQPHFEIVRVAERGAVVPHGLLHCRAPDDGVGADTVDRCGAEAPNELKSDGNGR